MATRIAHISDLHFLPRAEEQLEALARSIRAASPDVLVVTGDLTRTGTNQEFAAVAGFLSQFEMQKLVMPGNHDIPVPGIFDRLVSPFRRFLCYFPHEPASIVTPDVAIVGLNTAVGAHPGLDWSLGRVVPARIEVAIDFLRKTPDGKTRIIAAHHPLRVHALDPKRSRTAGGPEGFHSLSEAGMDLLLHGHLHRRTVTSLAVGGRDVCEIGASTALSDRERFGPSGFNILDVNERRWSLESWVWKDGSYLSP